MFDIAAMENNRIQNSQSYNRYAPYTIQHAIGEVHARVLDGNENDTPLSQSEIKGLQGELAAKIDAGNFNTIEEKVYAITVLSYLNTFEK